MEFYSDSQSGFSTHSEVEVYLDGVPLELPEHMNTLAGIRFHLELLALEHQRVLSAMRVDDAEVDMTAPTFAPYPFARIEAETIDLEQMPIQLIESALSQVTLARSHLTTSIPLVIINAGARARQIWWNLAFELKHPLVILNLLPESVWRPASGSVSVLQIRKWQLQQLAAIMRDVEKASWSEDPTALSNALEKRVVPWLAALERTLDLWHKTLTANPQVAAAHPR
jgi:hypothetical protein